MDVIPKARAPDPDVILWTVDLVRKKISSVITSLRTSQLGPQALAQLQMLDQKMTEFHKILDGKKIDPQDGMVKVLLEKVKQIVHRTEDFVEEVESQMLRCNPKACGESSSEVSASSLIEMELDNNEIDVRQSRHHRKRKFSYDEYVQGIINEVDGIVGRAKKVLFADCLPLGHQKCKRGKALHEGNISKISDVTLKADELGNHWDSLVEEFERFGLRDISPYTLRSHVHLYSYVLTEPQIIGRSNDVQNVLRMLFSESNRSRSSVSVLAVTGMGGLGKSTLAQLVYNHLRVCKHYDLMGSVHVSADFDVFQLTRDIIESLTKKSCRSSEVSLSSIQTELSHQVEDKSFLLVLDDVWNEDQTNWEALMFPLRSARFGHVIVTTRESRVARLVQTMGIYSLASLSFEDSFSLFKHHAFGSIEYNSFDSRYYMSREIVRKCKGNPLAVKLIGRLLGDNSDIEFWQQVLNLELWESQDYFLPVLKISYDQLPPILKFLFIMFSLFPKDYVFSKRDVVKYWLALGFIESERIANNYFENLAQRNLIEQNLQGTRKRGFIMHSLVHDLAQYLAGEEFVRAELGEQMGSRSNYRVNSSFGDLSRYGDHSRYVSIIVNNLPQAVNLLPLGKYHELRLLQIINKANKWNNCITIDLPDELFQSLIHLRILDLRYTGITALPISFGNLKQLRYLNLTRTNIQKLPDSISCLCYLNILELRDCPLRELPQGITKLVNLEYLNFSDKNICMPLGIGCLTNLQTLPLINIKRGSWHCKISELGKLKDLRGELIITGLRNVSSPEGAKEANLQSKNMIEVLTLDWSRSSQTNCNHFGATNTNMEQYDDLDFENIEAVFENLKPDIRLKELNIIDYSGRRFPKWFGDVSFFRLTKLSLNGCGENCEALPTLGLLPSLQSLYISWMYSVQTIGREFCSPNTEIKGFQSLEILEFKYIPNWVRWSGVENGEFCRLSALRILCCNELQSLPQTLSSSLTKLLINNCKELSMLPFLPSLNRLTLSGELSQSLLSSLDAPSLQFLSIACTDSETFLSLSEWKLPSLLVLVVKGCKNLQYIAGISSIITLKRLEIVRCRSVNISSDEEIPPSLQHLTIVRCHWLQDWYQAISVKYRDQLNNLREEFDMEEENNDYEMAIEETRDKDDAMLLTENWG